MYTVDALCDIHERAHRSLTRLLAHCRTLSDEECHREMPGFSYPSIQLQLHHGLMAERYWTGVLQGRIDVRDDAPEHASVTALEDLRVQVFDLTEAYLREASEAELNMARTMMTWGNREKLLVPAQVFIRTQTHFYIHQGEITAMCRVLGKKAAGLDFPID